MRLPIVTAFLAWAGRLRFRELFFVTAGLFVLDLLVPDFVPFVDELLLGLATLLFASWKDRRPSKQSADTLEDPTR